MSVEEIVELTSDLAAAEVLAEVQEQTIVELRMEINLLQDEKEARSLPHSERLVRDTAECQSAMSVQILCAGRFIDAMYDISNSVDPHKLVGKFHDKFGLDYDGPPRALPSKLSKFRVGFMHEELKEYRDAVDEKDLEGQLDALVDLVYVLIGTAHLQGFDFNTAFERVHRANMLKVRAKSAGQSKRKSEFDVVKPRGWKPPYLKDLV